MENLRELALFAGAGGGILGGHLLGWQCVCAVEIEDYPRRVLLARQRDGFLPRFPVWDDVTTFDGTIWRGRVDVVSGGFPCQDISAAGKGGGIRGARSGLWAEFARIISEIQPRYVFVENSPMLIIRGLDVVLGDLAALGYDAEWGIISAADCGAPHKRERIFCLAYPRQNRRGFLSDAPGNCPAPHQARTGDKQTDSHTWPALPAPEFWGGIDGVPDWVGKGWAAVGNAQVPLVAASAFRILRERIEREA